MKELVERFLAVRETTDVHGNIIILSFASSGMKFPKSVIQRVFNKYVEKDEYDASEKKEIIDFLYTHNMKEHDPYIIRLK